MGGGGGGGAGIMMRSQVISFEQEVVDMGSVEVVDATTVTEDTEIVTPNNLAESGPAETTAFFIALAAIAYLVKRRNSIPTFRI